MVSTNMWKVVLFGCCCCCFCFAGRALSELTVSEVGDHDQVPGRSPQVSNASFQVHKGIPSRSGRTYSRVRLLRGLLSPSEMQNLQAESLRNDHSDHETCIPSSIVDSSSALQSAQENNAFQVLAAAAANDSTPVDDGGRFKLEMIIGLAIAVPLFLSSLLLAWAWFKYCYLSRNYGPTLPRDRRPAQEAGSCSNSHSNMSKIQLLGSWLASCRSFSGSFSAHHSRRRQVVWLSSACEMQFSKLQASTNNFSANNLLGEGGTSRVYRAKLHDDTLAAVKRLDTHSDRRRTVLQFQSEVDLMRQVRHPNLVSLLGFCRNGDQLLLVYELMQNGSLEDQLYGPTKGSALTWNLRMKIALESARGLEYLHEHCVPPVVHRDLKASNILLDSNFNAKICDFGLATPLEGFTEEESLQLMGTVGYVAPEFFETGTLTEKSDVYAFGVVLLELLTGRKPIDHSFPPEQHSLVNWTKPQLTDRKRLPYIVAPPMKSHLNLKHLYQVAAVAALCVCEEPSYRPLIADVVQSLVPLVPIELGGALRPSHSHTPRSPAPGSEDLTPKRVKSRSRSLNNSRSTDNSV